MKLNKKLVCASAFAGCLAAMSMSTAVANPQTDFSDEVSGVKQFNQMIYQKTQQGRSPQLVKLPDYKSDPITCQGDGYNGSFSIDLYDQKLHVVADLPHVPKDQDAALSCETNKAMTFVAKVRSPNSPSYENVTYTINAGGITFNKFKGHSDWTITAEAFNVE